MERPPLFTEWLCYNCSSRTVCFYKTRSGSCSRCGAGEFYPITLYAIDYRPRLIIFLMFPFMIPYHLWNLLVGAWNLLVEATTNTASMTTRIKNDIVTRLFPGSQDSSGSLSLVDAVEDE